jgi:DNA-binding transcriptional MocR family regulator
MRQTYSRRRQLLYALLKRDYSDSLEPIPSQYGMHVAAWARDGITRRGLRFYLACAGRI